MRSVVPFRLSPREIGIAAGLTVLLWTAAIILWSAQDLRQGDPFPPAYQRVLIGCFSVGLVFSVVLAGVIAVSRALPRWGGIPLIAATAIVLAGLHGWIDAHLMLSMRLELGSRPVPIAELFYRGLLPFVLLYAFYATSLGLMLSVVAMRDSERRLAEARSATQQAQLAALRFQLNPHFLFNTLNAISSLIVSTRSAEAEQMTMKLSEFLRMSLETDFDAEVTLDEEFFTIQSYLDIEAVRFGDRLSVSFECPADLMGACVPSFLLQPLVENAVKYAVAPSRRPVALVVRASAAGPDLVLEVQDDGGQAFGATPASGTGLGLKNVRERLAAFYGEAARLDAMATAQGFVATIRLPRSYAATLRAAE